MYRNESVNGMLIFCRSYLMLHTRRMVKVFPAHGKLEIQDILRGGGLLWCLELLLPAVQYFSNIGWCYFCVTGGCLGLGTHPP